MTSIMMVNKLGEWEDDDEYDDDDDDDDDEEEEEDGSSALISPSMSMSSTGSGDSTTRDELSPRPRPRSCQRRKRRKRRQTNHRCRPNKKQSQIQGNSSIVVMALLEEICDILCQDLPSTDHNTILNGLRKLSDLCEEEEKEARCAKKFLLDHDGVGLMCHIVASAMNKLSSSSSTIENSDDDDDDSSTNSIINTKNSDDDDTGDRLGSKEHIQVSIVAAGIQVLRHLITSDHNGGSGSGGSGWEEVEEACLKMHRLGALDLVLQAMTKFVHNCNMQLVGCSFWNKYAACSKKCAKIVVCHRHHHHHHHDNNNNNCSVIPAILQAMKHHPNHKQLQTCAIRAISTICTQTPSQGGGDGGGSGAASVYKAGGFSALVRTVETIELDEETTKLAKKTIAQLNSYLQKNDTYACVLARA